jgi:predicted protein tyrosine phosphatase
VQVFGQAELVARLESGGAHFSHLISIGNPGRGIGRPDTAVPRIFRRRFQSILRLAFYDVEEKRHLGPLRPRRIPRRSDVRKIIRFYGRTSSMATGYTIHCWQGVSRSTAVALGVLYLMTGSEKEAGEILRRIRPEAWPHQKIVRYFDELLGCNLADVADTFRQAGLEELPPAE